MSAQLLTLTVEELNEYVRKSLAGDPILHGLRLRGEISNFKRHVSGHWYFTLKDAQSAINCAMFRQSAVGVSFAPRDGQRVVLFGSVGLYTKTGAYQFYADGMEPDGVGELYLQMEMLKGKLAREGLFDASVKKPLPLLPKGVAIITSGTGAVIQDIGRVAWRRHPGIPLYLYPVAVQGQGAAEQIAFALQAMDRLEQADVILVGRGGGSMEDLWPFNEEIVARAIAACHKPVVSAVGHETDFTIADFVADLRAPTPSAAAELIVPEREALLRDLAKLRERMRRAGEAGIAQKGANIARLRQRMAERTPESQIRMVDERVRSLTEQFALLADGALRAKAHRMEEAALRLRAVSPEATLQRGYALVRQKGKTVQSVNDVEMNAPLTLTLRDGWVEALATNAQREERS
ncbi:MAG TPA: exodeoxyribonuclease VII large subunit [Candidatus Limiplasma sp.]|nr:exodeoxyribonuclease VII large subunit [Candidatus Limiplasma sp.]HPS82097.1 exodeoxyribonuclease VII large subunit [Candidatus Limiplasma sp.]